MERRHTRNVHLNQSPCAFRPSLTHPGSTWGCPFLTPSHFISEHHSKPHSFSLHLYSLLKLHMCTCGYMWTPHSISRPHFLPTLSLFTSCTPLQDPVHRRISTSSGAPYIVIQHQWTPHSISKPHFFSLYLSPLHFLYWKAYLSNSGLILNISLHL